MDGPKILWITNNASTELYAQTLMKCGFTPFFVSSNTDTIDILLQSVSCPFVLVVSNIQRVDGGLSGVVLATQLKKEISSINPNLPILLSTVESTVHFQSLAFSKNYNLVAQSHAWQSYLPRLEQEYIPVGLPVVHDIPALEAFVTRMCSTGVSRGLTNIPNGLPTNQGMSTGVPTGMSTGTSTGMSTGMSAGMSTGMSKGRPTEMIQNPPPQSEIQQPEQTQSQSRGLQTQTKQPQSQSQQTDPATFVPRTNTPTTVDTAVTTTTAIHPATVTTTTTTTTNGTTTTITTMNNAINKGLNTVAPAAGVSEVTNFVVRNNYGLSYTLGRFLGQGNFGMVYLCSDLYGQEFVIKYAKTNRPRDAVEADWSKELNILFSLSHPGVIRVFDAFVHNNLYYLVLEKADGNMRNLIEREGCLRTESDVIGLASQILSGLDHIHSKGIIHRDLHIDNILYKKSLFIGSDGSVHTKLEIKISDFGISKILRQGEFLAQTFIGRDYDYAPELLTSHVTSKQSDIYQVGLILFFLRTGRLAISSADGPLSHVITSGLAQRNAQGLGSKLGHEIGRLLSVNPVHRPRNCQEAWLLLNQAL
eukprot:TRINITY_DN13021_c0_g2_i3.p1 TRINITY_DN13021_c0_g2~~TRINITY_DN13021_c0_g2_i3.p1  ORF type:complete len:589 (-),score=117.83 TRINITY_DN13021_c0_g2_i3:143-1909(-)